MIKVAHRLCSGDKINNKLVQAQTQINLDQQASKPLQPVPKHKTKGSSANSAKHSTPSVARVRSEPQTIQDNTNLILHSMKEMDIPMPNHYDSLRAEMTDRQGSSQQHAPDNSSQGFSRQSHPHANTRQGNQSVYGEVFGMMQARFNSIN